MFYQISSKPNCKNAAAGIVSSTSSTIYVRMSYSLFFCCKIYPIVVHNIKINICAAFSHNKFYYFRQYKLHVSAVLTLLRHLRT